MIRVLLLASLPFAQDPGLPGPPGAAAAGDGWEVVAGPAFQAGDRILTLRQLDQLVTREATRRNIPRTDPNYERLALSAIQELTRGELEPQAGEDLGLDPAQIERVLFMSLQDDRREFGTTGLTDRLADEGQSFQDYQEAQEAATYRDLWRGSKLGWRNLPMRPARDVFIRPGELRAIYRSNRSFLNPARVTLQIVQVPVSAYGGDEAAGAAYLEEARARALAGEDFSALVEEFSVVGRDQQGFHPPYLLPQISVPELQAWAADAREGEVGPVMAVELGDERFLMIPRMHAREGGEPPAFEEREVQQGLRKTFANERSNRILQLERNRLVRDAYTWLSPRLEFLVRAGDAPGRP